MRNKVSLILFTILNFGIYCGCSSCRKGSNIGSFANGIEDEYRKDREARRRRMDEDRKRREEENKKYWDDFNERERQRKLKREREEQERLKADLARKKKEEEENYRRQMEMIKNNEEREKLEKIYFKKKGISDEALTIYSSIESKAVKLKVYYSVEFTSKYSAGDFGTSKEIEVLQQIVVELKKEEKHVDELIAECEKKKEELDKIKKTVKEEYSSLLSYDFYGNLYFDHNEAKLDNGEYSKKVYGVSSVGDANKLLKDIGDEKVRAKQIIDRIKELVTIADSKLEELYTIYHDTNFEPEQILKEFDKKSIGDNFEFSISNLNTYISGLDNEINRAKGILEQKVKFINAIYSEGKKLIDEMSSEMIRAGYSLYKYNEYPDTVRNICFFTSYSNFGGLAELPAYVGLIMNAEEIFTDVFICSQIYGLRTLQYDFSRHRDNYYVEWLKKGKPDYSKEVNAVRAKYNDYFNGKKISNEAFVLMKPRSIFNLSKFGGKSDILYVDPKNCVFIDYATEDISHGVVMVWLEYKYYFGSSLIDSARDECNKIFSKDGFINPNIKSLPNELQRIADMNNTGAAVNSFIKNAHKVREFLAKSKNIK